MIDQPILTIRVFFNRVDTALNKLLGEFRISKDTIREYGGSFFVALSQEEDTEQNPIYIAYTEKELIKRFNEFFDDKFNKYDEISIQRATLIDSSLNCIQNDLGNRYGIVMALPYIKLIKVEPYGY